MRWILDWFSEKVRSLQKIFKGTWVHKVADRSSLPSERGGSSILAKNPPEFILSEKLAYQAAENATHRIDVSPDSLPDSEAPVRFDLVRKELSARFHRMLSAFAAEVNMSKRAKAILVQDRRFSPEFSDKVFYYLGLLHLNGREAKLFLDRLCLEFMGWLEANGLLLKFQWGSIELVQGNEVVLRPRMKPSNRWNERANKVEVIQ